MQELFSYRDEDIYVHHTRDEIPDQNQFQMHTHDSMEIYYFIEGMGQYIVEGNLYTIKPHDILIFRRGEMHMLLISPHCPYERLTIHFNPSIFTSIDPYNLLLTPFSERPQGRNNLYKASDNSKINRQFVYQDFDSLVGQKENVRLHILSKLLLLLIEINDEYRLNNNLTNSEQQTLSSKIIVYIHNHLFEKISLQSICEAFYISKSQANRIFKGETGYTIWDYVITKRLLSARRLLHEGRSPAEVCFICGFQDYSSFFRSYKLHFSVSPSADLTVLLDNKLT